MAPRVVIEGSRKGRFDLLTCRLEIPLAAHCQEGGRRFRQSVGSVRLRAVGHAEYQRPGILSSKAGRKAITVGGRHRNAGAVSSSCSPIHICLHN